MTLLLSNNGIPLFQIIRCSLFFCFLSTTRKSLRKSLKSAMPLRDSTSRRHQESDMQHDQFLTLYVTPFSTHPRSKMISSGCSTSKILLKKLEFSLEDHDMDDAIDIFEDYKRLYGLPHHRLVTTFITGLCYSCNQQWLQKASELVLKVLGEKPNFLHQSILSRIILSLAREQMPLHASTILWKMLENGFLPLPHVSYLIIHHMVKSDVGSFTMPNYLIEVYNHIQKKKGDKPSYSELTGIDTISFNMILDACMKFGLSFKGLQIIELMAQIGAVADAHSIVIISRIYEMNGLRDELNKFKTHIDHAPISFLSHYQPFYDSLLSLHFKFNDVDAVAGFILGICKCRKSSFLCEMDPQGCYVSIGSSHLKKGLKIEIEPQNLQRDYVVKLYMKQDLVMFKNGKLLLTKRALARLIDMYKNSRKLSELSKLILKMHKEMFSSEEGNLICEVIDACIHLGWLEVAHDILDDLEAQGASINYISYVSLLEAYKKKKMYKEENVIVRQMERAGFPTMGCVSKETKQSILVDNLLMELKAENRWISPTIYELNSSMYYFFKAKMIKDALKVYSKMRDGSAIRAVGQTFANLLRGYSSLEMYRDITFLWGDMKRKIDNENLSVNSDLYEFLLLNFLRGGYFERVMEIIDNMRKHDVYLDKGMYKREFLKFHKSLYKNLKASNVRSEVQLKRLEFIRAFQKWIGTD